MEYRPLIFAALFLVSMLYASLRGGAPERWAAGAYFAAYVAGVYLTLHKYNAFHTIEWGVFAIDLTLAATLCCVALQANRMWTIWAVSLQLVGVSAHLAKLVIPEILAPAYAATLMVWSYAAIPLLFLATARHRSRIKAYGNDPGWSVSPVA